MSRILLINPNSNPDTTARMCAIAARVLPEAPLGWTAPSGPDMIVTPEALDAAGNLVASATLPISPRAVIVSAFGDPGVNALACRLTCSTIGIGGAAARAAARTGLAFAVVTTTPALSDRIDALMMAHAARAPYLGCFTTTDDPTDLMRDADALDASLLCAIEDAELAGAAHVIIGGGPLGDVTERLHGISPVPLINPILCAAREVADLLAMNSP